MIAQARVHSLIVHHGTNVFLTEHEVWNFEVLFPSISIGSVLIAGLLDLRWKHFVFRKNFKGADPFSALRRMFRVRYGDRSTKENILRLFMKVLSFPVMVLIVGRTRLG